MKKFKSIFILGLLLVSSLVICQNQVSAETWSPFLTYGPVQNIDSYPEPVIPGDYSTTLRYNNKIKVSYVGEKKTSGTSIYFGANQMYGFGQEHYVLYENIGIYNGNYIDMKLNVENVTAPSNSSEIRVYKPTKDQFLRINLEGKQTRMDLSYEFYIHGTNQQIDFQGVWNYKRVNKRKSVILSDSVTDTPHIYASGNTELIYSTDIPNKFEVIGTTSGEGIDQAFSVTFDTKGVGLKQGSILRETSLGYLKYEQEPIVKMEVPTPQIVGHQTKYPQVKYTIAQDMPLQAKPTYYPKNYVLSIQLDPSVDVSTAQVEVKNIDEKVINFFQVVPDKQGNRLLLYTDDMTLMNNSDTSYLIDVSANLKNDVDLTDKYNDGFYHIPATVSYTTKDYNSNSRSANSKVEAEIRAKGKLQSVGQNTSTSDWTNKTIQDLFEYAYGVTDTDELEITNIENKTFSNKGDDSVKVTIRGKSSHLSKVVDVPVTVLEEKIATIHFIDENGKELDKTISKSGFEGQTYDYSEEIKKIPSYKFKLVDEDRGKPIKGEFNSSDKGIDIYIIYELDEVEIKVNFVDDEGKTIETELVKKYLSNQTHEISSQKIPGYLIKSVSVDGVKKNLETGNKISINVLDKGMKVTFEYESIHYSLKMSVDKTNVSQRDILTYQLNIDTGMVYETGNTIPDYDLEKITIPIDSKLSEISNVIVTDNSGKKVGIGQVDDLKKVLTITLTEKIKVTENIKIVYEALVKEDAVTDEIIKAQATMKALYPVNGSLKEIVKESNEVKSTISGGLQLVSAPKTIDFGKVSYQAKETVVGNPILDDRILVSDTRSNKESGWKLYASLEVPLSSEGKELDGSVVYRRGEDELILSSDNQEVQSYKGNEIDVDVTSSWGITPTSDGLKLRFKASDAPTTGQYQGKIRWTLTTGMP